jgi:mRNA-degrading endonuclease RelE of RelBE toxin-antitoxin system
MNFSETSEFSKDLKRLVKKYRSLPEDLEEFKKIVASIPLGTSKHFAVLHQQEDVRIIKARLFCRYLKGSSLRIVYAYHEQEGRVVFIELYFKGENEIEDQVRVRQFLDEI